MQNGWRDSDQIKWLHTSGVPNWQIVWGVANLMNLQKIFPVCGAVPVINHVWVTKFNLRYKLLMTDTGKSNSNAIFGSYNILIQIQMQKIKKKEIK